MFFLLACTPPEKAPATLTELSRNLLVEFESDAAPKHAQALADWLVAHVDDTDGYALELLPAEDFADILPQPEANAPERHLGVGVTWRVAGSVEEHAAVVPEADQSFADPTYAEWSRTIVEGTAQGFLGGESLRTDNFIQKSGAFGVTIPYPMKKDYHWLSLTQGDTPMFRSWSTDSGCADMGDNNCLWSGFTIELWVPDPGGLIWYNASWTELTTDMDGLIDDDYKRDEIVKGTIDYMEGTAAHATGEDG